MNRLDARYVGIVDAGGLPRPVYASTRRHQCNPYCQGGRHADLLFREECGALTRGLAQQVADLVAPGRRVLDVQPAPEAPLPEGFRTAWLVTYGARRSTRLVAELEVMP
jgi:hypothetical protein